MSRPIVSKDFTDYMESAEAFYKLGNIKKAEENLCSAKKEIILGLIICIVLTVLGSLTLAKIPSMGRGWPIALLCLSGLGFLRLFYEIHILKKINKKVPPPF